MLPPSFHFRTYFPLEDHRITGFTGITFSSVLLHWFNTKKVKDQNYTGTKVKKDREKKTFYSVFSGSSLRLGLKTRIWERKRERKFALQNKGFGRRKRKRARTNSRECWTTLVLLMSDWCLLRYQPQGQYTLQIQTSIQNNDASARFYFLWSRYQSTVQYTIIRHASGTLTDSRMDEISLASKPNSFWGKTISDELDLTLWIATF